MWWNHIFSIMIMIFIISEDVFRWVNLTLGPAGSPNASSAPAFSVSTQCTCRCPGASRISSLESRCVAFVKSLDVKLSMFMFSQNLTLLWHSVRRIEPITHWAGVSSPRSRLAFQIVFKFPLILNIIFCTWQLNFHEQGGDCIQRGNSQACESHQDAIKPTASSHSQQLEGCGSTADRHDPGGCGDEHEYCGAVRMQERKRGKTVLEKLAPVEQVRVSWSCCNFNHKYRAASGLSDAWLN